MHNYHLIPRFIVVFLFLCCFLQNCISPPSLIHKPLNKSIRDKQILVPRTAQQEPHTSSARLTEYLKKDLNMVAINTHTLMSSAKQSSLGFRSLEALLTGLSPHFLTIRGEEITLYQQEGQWKAYLKERAGSLQRARILPVYHHPSLRLAHPNKLSKDLPPYSLHVIEQGGNPCLYLGKMGLLGGVLPNVHDTEDAETKEELGAVSAKRWVYKHVSENLGLATPMAQGEERQRLQAYYQSQFAYIPKLLEDQEPQPVIKAQYQLMLLEQYLPLKNPKTQEIHDSIIAEQAQFSLLQSPIHLAELFKLKDTQADNSYVQRVRKVLLVGDPGIGKTTVSRQIAYLWAIGHEDAGFQAVYMLPVSALKETKYDGSTLRREPNLATAIANLCFEAIEDEEVYKRLRSQIQINLRDPNTLVILDGINEHLGTSKILLEEAHQGPHKLLLLSRPYGLEELRKCVDREVVHTGFNQSQVETYVHNYFSANKDKANDLLAFLKQYPNVGNIAHVPLSLSMLCSLWMQAAEELQAAKGSLNSLHRQLANYLWKRYTEIYNTAIPESRWLQNKDRDALFRTLGQLALHSLISGELPSSLQNFEHVLAKVIKDKQLRTILQESGFLARVGMDYHFPHLTLQEYFAGRVLAEHALSDTSASKAIVKEFLSAHQYQSSYQGVLAFLAGEVSQTQGVIGLAKLLRMLQEGPKEVVGLQHLFLELTCLNAYLLLDIGFPEGIEQEFACMAKLEHWFMQGLTHVHSYDSQLLNLLVGKLQSLPAVAQAASRIWYRLHAATQDKNAYVRYTALQNLVNLVKATQAQATTILPTLQAAIGDKNNSVRSAAIWSLLSLLQASPVYAVTVLPILLAATKDHDHVLQSVSNALDKLLRTEPNYAATILATLLAATKDQNKHIQTAATCCLSSLIQATPIQALAALPTLQTTMGEQAEEVREATIKTLMALVQVVAPDQVEVVLSSLVTALKEQDVSDVPPIAIGAKVFPILVAATKDQDKFMRAKAIWSLGSLVPAAPRELATKVLPILLEATGDKATEVRSTVNEVLTQLVQADPNQAIQFLPGLLTATGHKYYWVCAAAIQALGKLVQTAPDKAGEILPTLQAATKANYKVREAATKSLGELVHAVPGKAAEVLPCLLVTVLDEKPEIRYAAIKSLFLLVKADPNKLHQILPTLLTVLMDPTPTVRSATIQVLGKLGQVTPDQMKQLLPTLLIVTKDTSPAVRSAAIKALGEVVKANPSQAAAVLTSLQKIARDDQDKYVRYQTILSLKQLVQAVPAQAQQILPTLLQASGDKADDVRHTAISSINKLVQVMAADQTKQILPILQQAAKDKDTYVRSAAIKALGEVVNANPSQAAAVLTSLQKIARDDQDKYVRYQTILSLKQLVQAVPAQAQQILPTLLQASGDKADDVRHTAISSINKLVQVMAPDQAKQILPILQQAAKDKDTYVRSAAIWPLNDLVRIAPEYAKQLLPTIQEATRDQNQDVRKAANKVLFSLVKASPQHAITALPNLQAAAVDTTYKIRKDAIQLLGDLIQANSIPIIEALPSLQAATVDKEYEVRKAACEALGKLVQAGPDYATKALFSLLKALEQQAHLPVYSAPNQAISPVLLTQGMQNCFTNNSAGNQLFYMDDLPISHIETAHQEHKVYQSIIEPLLALVKPDQEALQEVSNNYICTAARQVVNVFPLAQLIQAYATNQDDNLLRYIIQRGCQIPLVFQNSKNGFQQVVAYTATGAPEVLGAYPIQTVQKFLQRVAVLKHQNRGNY